MRCIAVLAGIVLAGCLGEQTVDCGNGFFCPAGLACAAPGYCGEPAQVDACRGAADWDACPFADDEPASGSCRYGVCGACNADREGCTSGWTGMTVPSAGNLTDVWVADRADVYAIGEAGLLLHYDGIAWSVVTTTPPTTTTFNFKSIWGSSGDDFYIVATTEGMENVLRIRNRNELSMVSTGIDWMQAVWGTAADNVLFAGAIREGALVGAIRKYDGSNWQTVHSGGGIFTSIDGTSAANAFAARGSGAYARMTSSGWAEGPSNIPIQISLSAVTAGESDAFAIGLSAMLVRFDGSMWQPITINGVTTDVDLFGGERLGPSRAVVVGADGTIAESTNGTDWTDAAPPTIPAFALRAVDGTADAFFVVGDQGTIWRFVAP